MNEQLDNTEFDDLEPALDSAVQAVLAEPLPDDAVGRVKARATQLDTPTISPGKRSTWGESGLRHGAATVALPRPWP